MMKVVTRILIILCTAALSASGCAKKGQDQAQSAATKEVSTTEQELQQAPDEMLSSFSLSGFTKGGEKQWELEGKSADIGTEDIKLSDVTGKVYGKQTTMTIVADQGKLNRVDNNVHLEKNVKATTDDGATLTTDYLDWDAQNETLTTKAPVQIERGVMQARGVGIIAQPMLNLVQLEESVTVEMSLDTLSESEETKSQAAEQTSAEVAVPTVITCDGPLEVEYEKNLAIFHKNVVVKDKRGNIFADKMDVYFAKQEGKQLEGMEGMGIKKIISTGNVEIHHGDNITYSQKAVYDAETGKLTLTGQPKLVIYSTEGFSQLMGSNKSETANSEQE